jgi:hypothetical protein
MTDWKKEWDEVLQLVLVFISPATFIVTEHMVEHTGVKRTPKAIMPNTLNTINFLKVGFI